MFKRVLAIVLTLIMVFGLTACGEKYSVEKLPEYTQKEFGISGFWAPYDISVEGLQQYKDAGFNTLAMINGSMSRTSENQFYLGSNRTMTALENCKKVGLKAILNYNDRMAERTTGDENYNGDTPFSKYDLYGDYKDIISGVHICDEPKMDPHIAQYSDKTLIDDFKKVYPNADYIINLIPITAGANTWGYVTYQNMLDVYEENFMNKFDNPYISIDLYPFHTQVPDTDVYLVTNYEMIAKLAKKCDAEKTFILQASTGNEFEENLSEGDMRWQVYSALAFGADNLQYYCYSVPRNQAGDTVISYMYNYCILNTDDTPSDLYYYLQEIHKEIQSFADVILAYDWDAVIAVRGETSDTYRLSGITFNELENPKHYVSAMASRDLLISHFKSEQYGEGYMFVNFADRDNACTAEITFKDCGAVAIYGGEGYSGTPEIVELDENGNFTLELDYGEGVFVTPLV